MGSVEHDQRFRILYIILAEAAVMSVLGLLLWTEVIAFDIGVSNEQLAMVCGLTVAAGLMSAGVFAASMGHGWVRRVVPFVVVGISLLLLASFAWTYFDDSEVTAMAVVSGLVGLGSLGVAVHKFINPSE